MAWKCNEQLPPYTDQASRDAWRAGYSDGWYGYKKNNGDWPIQPYSQGYWIGKADKEEK